MNYARPLSVLNAEQIVFYLSAIPALAITIYGVIIQLYHSKIKWGIIPLLFLLGMAGLAIGGFSALVGSAMSVNSVLRNTLWAPAHFHTSTLMGIVLFILGFLFYLFAAKNNQKENKRAKAGLWIFVAGSYGFLLMFYLGGFSSIPANYARYTGMRIKSMYTIAVLFSQISVAFIIIALAGLFIMYFFLPKSASRNPKR
jgi:heme/copper-type cytochrome/quinol oxidase subunit 1